MCLVTDSLTQLVAVYSRYSESSEKQVPEFADISNAADAESFSVVKTGNN